MKTTTIDLHHLRVASPCNARWEDMTGDERSRFCAGCQKHVYNFSAMTRPEVAALIEAKEGRLCGRFYRRADGRLLTADCPEGSRRRRNRVARWCGSLCASVLMFFGVRAAWAEEKEEQVIQGEYAPPIQQRITATNKPRMGRIIRPTEVNPILMGKIAMPPQTNRVEMGDLAPAIKPPEKAPGANPTNSTAPLKITGVVFDHDASVLNIAGRSGQMVYVQCSPDFVNWIDCGLIQLDGNGLATFRHAGTNSPVRQFYRVVEVFANEALPSGK